MTLHRLGEVEKARSYYDQLVKELGQNPPPYDSTKYVAEAADVLGIGETGQEAALALHQEAVRIKEKLVEEHPNVEHYRTTLASSYSKLAKTYLVLGRIPRLNLIFCKDRRVTAYLLEACKCRQHMDANLVKAFFLNEFFKLLGRLFGVR